MRQGIVKNFLRSHFDKEGGIKDNGFRVQGSGFRVQGSGFRGVVAASPRSGAQVAAVLAFVISHTTFLAAQDDETGRCPKVSRW